jgi:hypothetical protein
MYLLMDKGRAKRLGEQGIYRLLAIKSFERKTASTVGMKGKVNHKDRVEYTLDLRFSQL